MAQAKQNKQFNAADAYAIALVNKEIKAIKSTLDKLPARIQYATLGGLYQWAMHGNTNPLNDLVSVLKSGMATKVANYVYHVASLAVSKEGKTVQGLVPDAETGILFCYVKDVTTVGEALAAETLAAANHAGRWDTWKAEATAAKYLDYTTYLDKLIGTDISKFLPAQHAAILAIRAVLATVDIDGDGEETETAKTLAPATIVTGTVDADALIVAQAAYDAETKTKTATAAKRETASKSKSAARQAVDAKIASDAFDAKLAEGAKLIEASNVATV